MAAGRRTLVTCLHAAPVRLGTCNRQVQVAIDDDGGEVRAKLVALEKKYAGVAKKAQVRCQLVAVRPAVCSARGGCVEAAASGRSLWPDGAHWLAPRSARWAAPASCQPPLRRPSRLALPSPRPWRSRTQTLAAGGPFTIMGWIPSRAGSPATSTPTRVRQSGCRAAWPSCV